MRWKAFISEADSKEFNEVYKLSEIALKEILFPKSLKDPITVLDRLKKSIFQLNTLVLEAQSLHDLQHICDEEYLNILLNVRKKIYQKLCYIKDDYLRQLNKSVETNAVNRLRAKLSLLQEEN